MLTEILIFAFGWWIGFNTPKAIQRFKDGYAYLLDYLVKQKQAK